MSEAKEVNPLIAEIDDLIDRAKNANNLDILLRALELKANQMQLSKFGF